MKKIIYTPDASDKLRTINRGILLEYGSKKAKEIVGGITSTIRRLEDNEQMGSSVARMFGIETDYRYIYTLKNYVFYRIERECIKIINIYNEKEDFMRLLFGIETVTDEDVDEYS